MKTSADTPVGFIKPEFLEVQHFFMQNIFITSVKRDYMVRKYILKSTHPFFTLIYLWQIQHKLSSNIHRRWHLWRFFLY